ncbi:MAG: hypothetical protein P8L78_09825 [Mariniblastus sp.]|nr:hypothetical protein [Mariniblastus sp.]
MLPTGIEKSNCWIHQKVGYRRVSEYALDGQITWATVQLGLERTRDWKVTAVCAEK